LIEDDPGMRALGLVGTAVMVATLLGCGGGAAAVAPIGASPTVTPVGESAVVIGSGETVRSIGYEVVAETNHTPQRVETCIDLWYPELEQTGSGVVEPGNCLTGPRFGRQLGSDVVEPWLAPAPMQFSPDAQDVLAGLATRKVARVGVTYATPADATANANAVLSSLTPQLANRIGVADRVGFFFLPLPAGADPQVSAFDAQGRRLVCWKPESSAPSSKLPCR